MQDSTMMRYMSPGPMSREPHSPVREEFQPVYPPQQTGNVRMHPPTLPSTQGEDEMRTCSQTNVDRYLSCETMPSDCRRFGNSGSNKRQGPPGGDSEFEGYSTLPSALGSYPLSPEHFEAEAEVLPVDYTSDTTNEPNTPTSARVGDCEKQDESSVSQSQGPNENDNGNSNMPEFMPSRRGKQSVSFAPQVDIQYPPSANHMQYPPPGHNAQYPSPSHERQYAHPPQDRHYNSPPHDRQYSGPLHDRQYSSTPYDRQYSQPAQYPPSRDGHYLPPANDGQYAPPGHEIPYPSSGHKQYPISGHDKQYPGAGHDKQYHPSGHEAQYVSSRQMYPPPSSMPYPPPHSPSSMPYPRAPSPSSMPYPRPASPSSMQYPPPTLPSSVQYPPPAGASNANYPPPDSKYPPPTNDMMYPPPVKAKHPPPDNMYPSQTNEKNPSPADAMYPPPVNEKQPPASGDMKYPPLASESYPPTPEKCIQSASDEKSVMPDDNPKDESLSKEVKKKTQTTNTKPFSAQDDVKPHAFSDGKTSARSTQNNLAPRLPSGQPSMAKAQQMYCPLTQYGDSAEEPEDDNAPVDEMPEMIPAGPSTLSRRSGCVTPNAKPGKTSSSPLPKPTSTPPISRTCSPGTGKLLTTPAQDTSSKNESVSRPVSPSNEANGDESRPSSRPPTPIPDKPLTSSELPIGDLNDSFSPSSEDCMVNIYPNPSQINSSVPNPPAGSPVQQTFTGGSPRPAGPVPASQMMVPPMGNFELPPEPSPVKDNFHPSGPVPASQMMMPPTGNFATDMQNQPCPPHYYGNRASPPPTSQGGNGEPWNNCYVPPPPWAQQIGQHYHSPNNRRTRSPSPTRERGRGASPVTQLDEFGRVMMVPARARSRCSSPGGRTDEYGREFVSRSPGPGSCGPESTRMWPSTGKRHTPTPRGHSSPRRHSSPSPMRGASPPLSQNYSSSWGGGGYYEPNSNFPSYPTEYCKSGQPMNNRPGSPRGCKPGGSSGLCDNIYPTPRQAQSPTSCGSPSRPDQYFYGEGDGGCGEPWRGIVGSPCEDEPIPSHWCKSPGPTIGHMSPKEWCRSRSRSRSRGNFHHQAQTHEAWPNEKPKISSYPTEDAGHGDVANSSVNHARNRSRSRSITRPDGKVVPSSPSDDEDPLPPAYPNPKSLKNVQPEVNDEAPQSRSLSRCRTPADSSYCQSPTNSNNEKHINSEKEVNAECQEGSVRRSRWEKFHNEQIPSQQQSSDKEEQSAISDQLSPKEKTEEVSDDKGKQSNCLDSASDECPLFQYPHPKRLSPEQPSQSPDKEETSKSQPELEKQTLLSQDQDSSQGTNHPQEIPSCSSGDTENDDESGPATIGVCLTIPKDGKHVKLEQPQVTGPITDGKCSHPQNDEDGTETDMEMAKYTQNVPHHPNSQSHRPVTLQSSSSEHPGTGVPITSPSPHHMSSPVNFYPSPQDPRSYPAGNVRPADYPYHEPPSSRRPRMPHPSHHQYSQQTYPNVREEVHPYHRGHPQAYQNQHYPPQGWPRSASPTPDQRNWQRAASPTPDQRNWQRGVSPSPDQRSWQTGPSPAQDPRYWPRGASTTHDQRRWPRSGSPSHERGWPQRSASPTQQRNWPQRSASPMQSPMHDQRGGWSQGSTPSGDHHHGQPHYNQQMMDQQPQRNKRGFPPNAGYGPPAECVEDMPINNRSTKFNEQSYSGTPTSQQLPPIPVDEETHQCQSVQHKTTGIPPLQQPVVQAPDYWPGSVSEGDECKITRSDTQETGNLHAADQHVQPPPQHCPEKALPQQGMQGQPSEPDPPDSPKRYNAAPPPSPRRYQDAAPPGSPKRPQEPVHPNSPKRYPSTSNTPVDDQEKLGRLTEEGQYREAGTANSQPQPSDHQFSVDETQLPLQRQISQPQQQVPCQQQPQSAQTNCQQQQPPNSLQQTHQQQSFQQQGCPQLKRSQTPMLQNEPHAQQQQAISQLPPTVQQPSQMQSVLQVQQPTQAQQSLQAQQQSSAQQKPPSPAPQTAQQPYSQQQRSQGQADQYSGPTEKQQIQDSQQSQQYSQNQPNQPVPSSNPSTPIKQHGDGPVHKIHPPTPPSPMMDGRKQQKGSDLENKTMTSPRDHEKQLFEEISQPIVSPRQMPALLPIMSPRKTPPHSTALSPRNLTPQQTPSPRKLPSTPITASPRKVLSTIEEHQQERSSTPKVDSMDRCDEPQYEETLKIQELQGTGSTPSTPKSHKSDSSCGNESNRGNETSRTNESNRTHDSNRSNEFNHDRQDLSVNSCEPQERDLRAEVNRRITNWMNSTNMRMEEPSERVEMPVRQLQKEINPAPSPLKKQGHPVYPASERMGSMGDGSNVNSGRTHTVSSPGNVRNSEIGSERNTILKEMVRRSSSNKGKETEDAKKLDKLAEALAEAERIMNTCRAKDNAVKETLGLKPGDNTRVPASDFTRLMPKSNTAAPLQSRETVNPPGRHQLLSNVSQSGPDAWRSSAASRVGDSPIPSSQNRWTPRDILNAELERRTSGMKRNSGADSRETARMTQSSSELRDIISNLSNRAKARATPTMADVRSSSSALTRQESAMSMTSLRSKGGSSSSGIADGVDAKRRSSTQDVRRQDVRGDPKTGNLDDEKFASMRDKFLTFFNNYQRNSGNGGGGGSTRH